MRMRKRRKGHSRWGQIYKRGDKEVGTAVGTTGLRDSYKRSTDTARLDEFSYGRHRSKGAESRGQIAGLYRHKNFYII